MTIDQVQMDASRWRQFWDSFKAEPQQVAGIWGDSGSFAPLKIDSGDAF